MGGNKGGTTYQTSSVSIPPEVLARYNAVNARAEEVANTPFMQYGGEFVAPINAVQGNAINNLAQNSTAAAPYVIKGLSSIDWGSQAAIPYFGRATDALDRGVAAGAQGAQAGMATIGSGINDFNAALGTIDNAYSRAQPFNAAADTQIGTGLAAASPYNAAAGQSFGAAYQGAQPYQTAATGLAAAGTQAINPGALEIGRYMSPYNDAVVEATMRNLQQQQRMEQNRLTGNAILEGAWGGDRAGIAKANLARQQDLASGAVLSGLYNQNYAQAIGAAQQQQGVGLAAGQANREALTRGATTLAGIGQQGFAQGLGAGQAYQGLGNQLFTQGLGAGQAYQSLGNQVFGQGRDVASTYGSIGNSKVGAGQAQASVGDTQFRQGLGAAQGYQNIGQGIYDLSQNYAQTAIGAGTSAQQAALGAGTLAQQTDQARDAAYYNQFLQQQGYPFQVAQFLANIAMGTGALSGSTTSTGTGQPQPYFSDERLKENVHTIGYTNDGQPIIRFNYKGQKGTQIGLSAQETEKHHPEAVGESQGFKTVDYDVATRDAIKKAGGGGLTAGLPAEMAELLQQQNAMFPYAAHNARGIPAAMAGGSGGARPSLMTAKPPEVRPTSTGLREDMRTLRDVTGFGESAATLGKAAKDAAVGTAAKGKEPASGGLLGHGGKWDPENGWFGKQIGSSAPSSGSGSITSTPLPPPDTSGLAGAVPADMATLDPSLLEDVSSLWAARGGRVGLAAGGMPYGDNSILPPELYDVDDPEKLKSPEPPKPGGQSSGSSGMGEVAQILGTAAKLGMMFLNTGGAVKEPSPDHLKRARKAIKSIEGDYHSVGPWTNGDRPYGAYQVMGKNLPMWTEEAIGRRLTPEEFLNDADAQDTVFDHHFGKAWRKHGSPEDAAAVWFTGQPRGVVKSADVLGTTPDAYVAKFSKALGSGESGGTNAEPKHVTRALEIVSGPRPSDEPYDLGEDSDRHATQLLKEMGLGVEHAARGGRQGLETGGVPADLPPYEELDPFKYFHPRGGLADGLPAFKTAPELREPTDRPAYQRPFTGLRNSAEPGYDPGAGARTAPFILPSSQPPLRGLPDVSGAPASPRPGPTLPDGTPITDGPGTGLAAASPPPVNAAPPAGAPPRGGQGPTREQLEEIRRGFPADRTPSLNVPADAPPRAASGLGAGSPATGEEPGFFDRQGWFGRNERPIMGALGFLGGMLGSPSRQLPGAIGHGLAAAAPMYLGAGFKQQGLDIAQQQANTAAKRLTIAEQAQAISLLSTLRQQRAALINAQRPVPPELDAQIDALTRMTPGGVGGGPTKAPDAPGGSSPALTPGPVERRAPPVPAASEPAATGPAAPTATGPVEPPAPPAPADVTKPPPEPQYGAVTGKLDPNFDPVVLQKKAGDLAESGATPEAVQAVLDRAAQNQKILIDTGRGPARDGSVVEVPGWQDWRAAQERRPENNKWREQQSGAQQARQQLRMQIEGIRDVIEKFETGALAETWGEAQRKLKALGLPVPNTATMNAAAFQTFIKDAYGSMLNIANSMPSGGATDALREQVRAANANPALEPEANRKILSQTLGVLNWADKQFNDATQALEMNPTLDRAQYLNQWTANNPLEKFRVDAEKSTAVRGAVPTKIDDLVDGQTYIMTPQNILQLYGKQFGDIEAIRKKFGGKDSAKVMIRKRASDGYPEVVRVP